MARRRAVTVSGGTWAGIAVGLALVYAVWWDRYRNVARIAPGTQASTYDPHDAPDSAFKEGVRPSGALPVGASLSLVRPSGIVTIYADIHDVSLQNRASLSDWRDLVETMQGQLNALGASPRLAEDGLIGRHTAAALDALFARWPYGSDAARWNVRDRGRWWRAAALVDNEVQTRSGRSGLPLPLFPHPEVLRAALDGRAIVA